MAASDKTPLHDEHLALGARMVPFGGWHMPIHYSGVLAEHNHVREKCGIFDVSHMGELSVAGADALAFLQYCTINDVAALDVGKGQYTALLYESGGFVDDLILYRIEASTYLLCVNAANTTKDYQWLCAKARDFPDLMIANRSAEWGQIAVQGPLSDEVCAKLLPADEARVTGLPYMSISPITVGGEQAWMGRTGYTGERGYELYLPLGVIREAWRQLVAMADVQPIGLGARDTLRLEACYLLYGNDIDENISALEAGLGWVVRWGKGSFIGREALEQEKGRHGAESRRIQAFLLNETGIPRAGMACLDEHGQQIGRVTSGSVLPTVGGSGGLALLSSEWVPGREFWVDIRGKRKLARIAKKPLYTARVH